MKSINQEEFFKKISIYSEGTDLDTVRRVYYGMVRTISRELKERQVVVLPDWGKFLLKIAPARMHKAIRDNVLTQVPAKPLVKFAPCMKVKKYFYTLGQ
jgi:nucleoid DNA-binding protein